MRTLGNILNALITVALLSVIAAIAVGYFLTPLAENGADALRTISHAMQ